jgi:hypothetical protein
MSISNIKQQDLTKEKLAELSKRSDTTVYEYINDTPEAIMNPNDQLQAYRLIVGYFDDCCSRYPTDPDESIRERVLNTVPDGRLFQRLFPKIFAFSTVRVSTPEEEAVLDTVRKAIMIMLLERASTDGDEATRAARAMHNTMRLVTRMCEPKDLENTTTVDVGKDADGSQRDIPKITPLSRHDLGASSVKQNL